MNKSKRKTSRKATRKTSRKATGNITARSSQGKKNTTNTRVESEGEKKARLFKRADGIVRDEEFWANGNQLIKLLEPIIAKIGLLEADQTCVSLVYWSFMELLSNPLYSAPTALVDTAQSIRKAIESRWNFIHTDAMGVAYLLDQTKLPGTFIGDDRIKTVEQIHNIAERLGYSCEEIAACDQQVGVFWNLKQDWDSKQRKVESRVAPLEWWGNNRDLFPILFRIARRIFTTPISSAATERNWSIHSFIHSDHRNRLGLFQVLKLVFLYSNRVGAKSTPMIVYDALNLHKTGTGDENSDEEDGPRIYYPADSDSSDDDEQYDRMSSSLSDEAEGRVPAQEGDEGLEDQADIYTSLYFLDMSFDYSGDHL